MQHNNKQQKQGKNVEVAYNSTTRVIVVGAGISGLACAKELVHRGYQVLIVEARDRLGGRLKGGINHIGGLVTKKRMNDTHTATTGEKETTTTTKKATTAKTMMTTTTPIDLGGALIHGIDQNPIYTITKQMGIPTRPVSDCLLFDTSGWPVDSRQDEKVASFFNECLDETFRRISTNDDSTSKVSSTERMTGNESVSNENYGSGRDDNKNESRPDEDNSKTGQQQESRETGQKEPNKSVQQEDTQQLNYQERPRKKLTSFGALFDAVCSEKGYLNAHNGKRRNNLRTHPLFLWQKANLEVSCGASFHDLGYTWNDDEPYGFVGDHVALETSWDPVMQGLAEGLDILYSSPVSQIHVIPNIPKATQDDIVNNNNTYSNETRRGSMDESVSGTSFEKKNDDANEDANDEDYISEGSTGSEESKQIYPTRDKHRTKNPNRQSSRGKKINQSLPSRRSRRLLGEDVNLRRSDRKNKGVIIDRFCVKDHSSLTYHGDSSTYETFQRKRKRKHRNEEKSDTENELPDDERYLFEKEHNNNRKSLVQVTLKNGTVLEADALVCTLPLGILKLGLCVDESSGKSCDESQSSNGINLSTKKSEQGNTNEQDNGERKEVDHVKFFPPLSERKQTAIQRLGCGLLNKCALSFSHVFWQDSDFLGLADPKKPCLVLNAAAYTHKPILIFMYGGSFAKEIESLRDNKIVEDCMSVLKKICKSKEIPKPLDYIVTRWGQEKYSRMAFSYVPPNVNGAEEYEIMSEPINDPYTIKTIGKTTNSKDSIEDNALNPSSSPVTVLKKPIIMFAGEHTTPHHPSTIHGAFLSGIREAYRMDLYMEPKLNDYLKFENDHLYHYTFPISRIYNTQHQQNKREEAQNTIIHNTSTITPKKVSTKSDKVHQQDRRQLRRRRRAAGFMNLRRDPRTVERLNSETFHGKKKEKKTIDASAKVVQEHSFASSLSSKYSAIELQQLQPKRRSQRSLSTLKKEKNGKITNGFNYAETDDIQARNTHNGVTRGVRNNRSETKSQKEDLISLERRVLVRAIDSFGSDYFSFQSKVLPVFGSSLDNDASKNATDGVAQIRARCRQILRSLSSLKKSNPIPKLSQPDSHSSAATATALVVDREKTLLSHWMAEKEYRVPVELLMLYDGKKNYRKPTPQVKTKSKDSIIATSTSNTTDHKRKKVSKNNKNLNLTPKIKKFPFSNNSRTPESNKSSNTPRQSSRTIKPRILLDL